MGVIQHHCVVAVNWDEQELIDFRNWISHDDRDHFIVGTSGRNGYFTVCLMPDGSKEGWPESDKGDERRRRFIRWLDSKSFKDGSNSWKYIEATFGEQGSGIITEN